MVSTNKYSLCAQTLQKHWLASGPFCAESRLCPLNANAVVTKPSFALKISCSIVIGNYAREVKTKKAA